MRRRRRKAYILSTPQILLLFSIVIIFLSLNSLGNFALQLSDTETVLLIIFLVLLGACVAGAIWYATRYVRKKRFQNITLFKVDQMTGVEFEDFIAYLYEQQGYRVEKTPLSGDLGVDLIASNHSVRIAIQVKRYTGKVGRSAVSDAVAGMAQYKCTSCAVITNSYFTPLAYKLAWSNHCQLFDRTSLSKMILITHNQPQQ